MARIRSLKPEAFSSETLAEVSVNAERTFFGLSTHADDSGRFRDQAAVINGLLWSLRKPHSDEELEDELCQLAEAELICRYTGCDGKRYLHLVSWKQHQRVEKASRPRYPRCNDHSADELCHGHDGSCPPPPKVRKARRPFQEDSGNPPGTLPEPEKTAGQSLFPEPSGNLPGTVGEPSARDLRIEGSKEREVPPTAGAQRRASAKPKPKQPKPVDDTPEAITAQTIIGEYIDRCANRPPGHVIGQLGKSIRQMLDEGIDPDAIRRGMATWASKGLNPSTLPSVVNEVINPPLRMVSGGYQPFQNPDPADYYGEL